jgi:hypothetical protein
VNIKAESKSELSKVLQRFQIISTFFIGLGGLVLSGTLGFSTIYFSHHATERQANAQIEARVLQRHSSTAQLELSLMPILTHGTDSERQFALSVLAVVDPDEAKRISTVVIPQLKSVRQRSEASQVIASVPERKREQEFRQHLQNAAIYRQFSLDASACREYFAAFDNLSVAVKSDLAQEIEKARKEYSRGEFSDAAGHLQSALEKTDEH